MLRNGWEYRLMKRAIHGVTQYNWIDVVAVTYRADGGVDTWTEQAAGLGAETIEGVRADLGRMAAAFELPVLDEWVLIAKREKAN